MQGKSNQQTTQKTPDKQTTLYPRVLAVSPMNRGFGYAVFNNPQRLVEWGTTDTRINRITTSVDRFERLVDLYKPQMVIILEIERYPNSVGQKIARTIKHYCAASMISHKSYSRKQLRDTFASFDALSRFEIVDQLIEWFPMLQRSRPKKTAIWESEDIKLKAFDACAASIAFYVEFEEGMHSNS